jgi:diguanylate cyclase (GGDEF)-like protein
VLEDGSERSVRQQCEIVRDVRGNAVRLVASIHDITESKALQRQLAHRAFHDALTSLPNRALFTERLQHALSNSSRLGKQVAVLFLDLDGFKLVNDGLGHDIGDRLLVALAGRLQAQLQPGDVAARFGGDEFTVLLDRLESPESAINWAKWAASALSEPFALEGHEAFVGVSIGIAVGIVGRATAPTLLRDADTALYQAKSSGKNQIAIFEPRMNAEALRKLDLQVELRKAVERGEIVLHYQPVVDLSSGHLVGVEALARWQHPTRGLLSPEAFLPLAEETGLILPLGEWVLAEACSQIAAWGRIYPSARKLKVGVNLSVRQLRTPRLIADIASTLSESRLPPEQLELEITEEIVAKDLRAVASALEEIQSLGVKLALDDVGSGHSSLGHFRHLTFDSLKLDGSFLIDLDRDGRSRAIAEAVAGLAGALGIQVTAEGIESMDQLVLARGLGCQLGQGYKFARPLRPKALATMLDRQIVFPIAEVIVHQPENRRDLDASDSLVAVS